MADRLDPRPLGRALISGLRHRRSFGPEPEDRFTKLFLFGLPIAGAISAGVARFELSAVGDVLAAASLFVGALLAAFAQLAAWRERFTSRNLKIDAIKTRALDEAVSHVLSAVLASVALTGILFVAANTSARWVDVASGSFAVGILVYLGVTLLIVVNLLWDAYRAANPEAPVVARPRSETDDREAG